MPYTFDLEKWLPLFPLVPQHGHYAAGDITSPYDICTNEHLRRGMQDQFDWGEAVPVDIFVMSLGEPERRDVTKIGGLPYRAASKPWPKTEDGRSMALLAQFNFADSKDIVGDLPGDLLLIFGDDADREEVVSPKHYEWQQHEIDDELVGQVPSDCMPITPCFGNRCRTVSFPDAMPKWRDDQDYPQCHGHDVWRDYLIPTYQATQIGRAPFFTQPGDDEGAGVPLCTIASVQPAANQPFPWVNVQEPAKPSYNNDHLMIGDLGCIYVFIDDWGRISFNESCY